MKKFLSIAALVFGMSFADMAYAAPDNTTNDSETDTSIEDLFSFADDNIDPTTAFINFETETIESDATSKYEEVSNLDVEDIIAYAKKYLGRPYVSGGKGPRVFDCSGFTSYVFRNFNISLSPSAITQATQGKAISKAEIQPGDLIFFKGRRGNGIGHVAMCIDNDPQKGIAFIHAASRGVVIDRLNNMDYYKQRYVCARRVLK